MDIVKKNGISTERLLLKPFAQSDRERLAGMLMDEEVSKTYMVPQYPDKQGYLELADTVISCSSPENKERLVYGIYLNNELIGLLNDCGHNEDTIEVGYVIHPDYKGRGYATEALKAVIDEIWDMGFERIFAGYFEENAASRKVMEKCGMVPCGSPKDEEYRGKIHKCHICEILRK